MAVKCRIEMNLVTRVRHEGVTGALLRFPRALRRLGLFFMVMAVSIPVFLVGLLVVLWHLGH